jgi:hypothetical protein
MALLPILFFTTDIYKKVNMRWLKCIRTIRKQTWSWFKANVIKIPLPLRVCADNRHFPENFVFSQFHLNKRIWRLCQKTNIHVSVASVLLWVAFSVPSGSLSLVKYPVENVIKIDWNYVYEKYKVRVYQKIQYLIVNSCWSFHICFFLF